MRLSALESEAGSVGAVEHSEIQVREGGEVGEDSEILGALWGRRGPGSEMLIEE